MTKFYKIASLVLLCTMFCCNNKVATVSEILVATKQFNFPVLIGKKNNPVLRICINDGKTEKVLEKIQLNFTDGSNSDIKEVRVFFTGEDSTFNDKIQFGKTLTDLSLKELEGYQVLNEAPNYFWISFEVSNDSDLNKKLNSDVAHVIIDGETFKPIKEESDHLIRKGIALRQHLDDNVHTYRIPGLTTSNKGTLLATYDVRRDSGRDLQGNIDIGLSRSIDGGLNWEPMRIVLDMKTWGGLPEKFNGVSDACVLVDKTNNDIYVAGLWMYGVINSNGEWIEGLTVASNEWNHQWRDKGSQPGLKPKQTSQFLITKSTDDGKTWSAPINITDMCKDPKWWLFAPGPGHGITLKDGTLLFPTQGRDENGLPFSNITYSKDHGKTWITSKPAFKNTTESMAVELLDGGIMLNSRDNRNRKEKGPKNGRAVAVSYDMGETWVEHVSSHGALIESVCMASIHRHYYTGDNGETKSMLLFSNPNSKFSRIKQTIKVSFDEGVSWPEKYWIELDEGKGRGYSCLTSIDEETIGILYEGSQADMTFQTLKINDILIK